MRSEAVGHNAISYRPLDTALSHLHLRLSKFGWTTFALRDLKRYAEASPLKSKVDHDFASPSRRYGLIPPEDGGKDAFVHASAIERAGMNDLSEGKDRLRVGHPYAVGQIVGGKASGRLTRHANDHDCRCFGSLR
jgi:cold shock CspA family protein